jgi:hypothetical protein
LPTRFVGTIILNQSFLEIYTYFTSGHLILNIATATYFLYVVAHFSTNASGKACQTIVQNPHAKHQCIVPTIPKWVYFVATVIVLLVELCASVFSIVSVPNPYREWLDGALVVGHYARQLKSEKRFARRSRIVDKEAMRLVYQEKGPRYSSLPDARSKGLTAQVYMPCEDITQSTYNAGSSHEPPAIPVEAGYGGGLWTHEDISAEEKARLKDRDDEIGLPELAITVVDEDEEMDMREHKSPMVPQHSGPMYLPPYVIHDEPRS